MNNLNPIEVLKTRITIYRLMLLCYVLSFIFPKKWLSTDKGFCHWLSSNYNNTPYKYIYQLNELHSLRRYKKDNPCYWYKKGALLPRIKLIIKAIKMAKNSIILISKK